MDHPHLIPTGAHCVFCGQTRPALDEFGVPTPRLWLIIRTGLFALLTLGICGLGFYQAGRGILIGVTRPLLPSFGPVAEGIWARIFGAAWLAIACVAAIWFIRRFKSDFGS